MELVFHGVLGFLGGLGIFLYGTHLLSNGLQKLAASKTRKYLTKLTNTRLKGVLSGIVTTFFLQSSTVTSIMVVGLVGTSVISLSQAFGVIVGSAIGTTLTVQILTLNISMFSTLFIFIGVILIVFLKHGRWRLSGVVLLSIGFIFYGIHMISSSLQPLTEYSVFLDILITVSNRPILFAVIAMFFTALLHSSAAMIIIGIAFVTTGILPVHSIIPLVIGANVGSTIPVIISSLITNKEGKKLAFFYFFIKTTGGILAFIFLTIIIEYFHFIPGDEERQIANFHTLFNVFIAILFFPILPYLAKLFDRILPKNEEEFSFTVRLNEAILKVPEEALASSKQQIIRLSKLVKHDMINQLSKYIDGEIPAERMHQVEQIIDDSYIKIQRYLLKIGQRDLTSEQSILEVKLLNILNEIEHIGDTVVRFIGIAEKVHQNKIKLDDTELQELKKLLDHISQNYTKSIKAIENNNIDIAKENIQAQSFFEQYANDVKFNYYNNLISKEEHNKDLSATFLDIINQLLQVNHHAMNISRTILGLI